MKPGIVIAALQVAASRRRATWTDRPDHRLDRASGGTAHVLGRAGE